MKKLSFVVIMLCASLVTYAQVEQAAQKLAETQHKQFASDLSNSLKSGRGKPIFGIDGKDQQFLLEDSEQVFADFLGWKKAAFDKRSLPTVYQGLLAATKQKDAKKKISVNISFPVTGAEFKGPATDKKGKTLKDVYTVTTTAETTVEATKQGSDKSVAKSIVTLNWDITVILNKKTGSVDSKASRAILRSITVEQTAGFFNTERQQIQSVAETLIKDYYQSLKSAKWSSIEIPADWKSPLQSSTKRETEGNVTVSLPTSTTFEVKTVPELKIFVNADAFHKVALSFKITVSDDLKSGKITSVSYTELAKPIIVEPEPEPEPEPAPVVVAAAPVVAAKPQPQSQPVVRDRGTTYKVQILSLNKYVAISDLPQRFRVDDVTIEKYVVGGVTYYKYTVPGGTSVREAVAVRAQMRNRGLTDSWIAIYENGERVAPRDGVPEIVR